MLKGGKGWNTSLPWAVYSGEGCLHYICILASGNTHLCNRYLLLNVVM